VRAELDEQKYPKAIKVTDAQMAAVNLTPHSFHGDWNYFYLANYQETTPQANCMSYCLTCPKA
jgi:hypothetical protein